MKKTHTGGCHCGNVRYEVEVDATSSMECNCSHCSKKGFLLSFVPADAFKLTHGDESTLSDYRFNKKHVKHLFCPTCGVQSFGRGTGPDGKEMVAVNVRCLDDIEPEKIAIKKVDGKSF